MSKCKIKLMNKNKYFDAILIILTLKSIGQFD